LRRRNMIGIPGNHGGEPGAGIHEKNVRHD
jgi:hypothetical protein